MTQRGFLSRKTTAAVVRLDLLKTHLLFRSAKAQSRKTKNKWKNFPNYCASCCLIRNVILLNSRRAGTTFPSAPLQCVQARGKFLHNMENLGPNSLNPGVLARLNSLMNPRCRKTGCALAIGRNIPPPAAQRSHEFCSRQDVGASHSGTLVWSHDRTTHLPKPVQGGRSRAAEVPLCASFLHKCRQFLNQQSNSD